jgi:hypothetical protein
MVVSDQHVFLEGCSAQHVTRTHKTKNMMMVKVICLIWMCTITYILVYAEIRNVHIDRGP